MRYFSTLRYLVVLLVLLCTACGTALPSIKPYKLDVQQGNVVTSKMLLQLRPGMTKSQVRFIMGTPLIQDSFHGNRWDYVYQMREAGKVIEQRRVILDFEKDLLKAVRGDVVPAGSAAPEAERANTGTRLVEPNKKPEEKSLINKLKFWEKDEATPAKEPATKNDVKKVPEPKAVESKMVEPKKVDAAEQSVVTDAPAPKDLEASPSMLAVPLAVPAATAAEVAAPVVVPAEPSPAPVVEATPSVPEVTKQPEPEIVPPVAAPVESPTNAPLYESASGMVFDRKLRSLPEEVEPDAVAATAAPRVGNKVAPKPADLPPETEPSFFDRMLEKIGF